MSIFCSVDPMVNSIFVGRFNVVIVRFAKAFEKILTQYNKDCERCC